jgi:hypothetical protein
VGWAEFTMRSDQPTPLAGHLADERGGVAIFARVASEAIWDIADNGHYLSSANHEAHSSRPAPRWMKIGGWGTYPSTLINSL